jgi:Zn-dependent M28 family amino/carboxypeptidase
MQKKELYTANVFLFTVLLLIAAACGPARKNPETIGKNLENDIAILSSDEFEGRAPASAGGEKSVDFIRSRFMEAGLQSGNGDSYLQEVPLLEITGYDFSPLTITGNNTSLSFNYLDDMVVGTYRLEEEIAVNGSEMIFVGYGIVAPEYNWNDYEDLDVRGKTVVILVNDPGFATGDEAAFTGRAMTYYGRWTYKFEEAARQGATAALIIHETEPASYGWEVVRNSWSGTQYGVVVNGNSHRLPVEGWVHYTAAEQIFSQAGIDLDEAKTAAATTGFKAIPMGIAASVSFRTEYSFAACHNVLGYIKGSRYPNETIVYMAHWDHLGKVKGKDGVDIYNGAIDNATGVAALFAIAEAFQSEGKAPERSILFLAVTAEESGLLGSKYYAEHPTFPLATKVGGINIDALNVYGPTHDVVSIGYGLSDLDYYLEKHAATQERVVKPNPYPERGYYYRSDHFNMARQGVPMIYANGGNDYVGRDEAYRKMVQEDAAKRYHSPNDVVNDLWNFDGMRQDIWLFFQIGKELANSRSFPNWAEGNEFRAVRDASEQLRRE